MGWCRCEAHIVKVLIADDDNGKRITTLRFPLPVPVGHYPTAVAGAPLPGTCFEWAVVRRVELSEQTVEHFAHVHDADEQARIIRFRDHSNVARKLEMTLYFRYGSNGISNIPCKLGGTVVYAALNDICRHGHRSAHELVAKVATTDAAYPRSDSMSIDRQILSRSPNP